MGIKRYKPTSPARRFMTVSTFEEITCTKPERSLLEDQRHTAGRNAQGRITVRHHGGGNKRKYRIIDFKRNKDGIEATVKTIEYDPNRTANIALLVYKDGEKRYILAPLGIIARAAGNAAQLMAKEGGMATLKMPSGEMRYVSIKCKATIGQVGNLDHEIIRVGKAGKTRHMGIRPTVRGAVMNPCDHPHGGGEGKAPVGHAGPLTPWGKPALGYKTRKKKNKTDKFILKRVN